MFPYSTHATDIVAYTFNADTYAPDCIGEMFGWRDGETAETTLDRVAAERGIDRNNERSYDSGDFPKVVFASDDLYDEDGRPEACGRCHKPIVDH